MQFIPFIANAFSIYLFYQYFDSIPKELDEAAKVDGAGWFTIYRKIVMPLSGPAIATVAILTFLPAWNSVPVAADGRCRPRNCGRSWSASTTSTSSTSRGAQIMAYAVPDHHPGAGLFIAFQRSFINSIASSGVKG